MNKFNSGDEVYFESFLGDGYVLTNYSGIVLGYESNMYCNVHWTYPNGQDIGIISYPENRLRLKSEYDKELKEKEMKNVKVNWNKKVQKYFNDVEVGQTFVIDTAQSHGAVYMKVQTPRGKLGKLELATGKLFEPTSSPVKLVDVEINVAADKPSNY